VKPEHTLLNHGQATGALAQRCVRAVIGDVVRIFGQLVLDSTLDGRLREFGRDHVVIADDRVVIAALLPLQQRPY
jgi:hypothetical protein